MNKALRNFVVVEGPHGSGKTTIAKLVVRNLSRMRIPSIYTKEPNYRLLIPVILSLSTLENRSPLALAYLIAADRLLHTHNIRRWIKDGLIVIADRYAPSSLVYQKIDGLSSKFIKQLNSFAPPPYLSIFMRAPLDIRDRRVRSKRKARPHNFFLTPQALKKEQVLYDEIMRKTKGQKRVLEVDGTRPAKENANLVSRFILKHRRGQ